MNKIICLIFLVFQSQGAFAALKGNIALVYKGPGSCDELCSESAAAVAKMAGLVPKYVGPHALTKNSSSAHVAALFSHARVWIQPGGNANEAYDAMSDELTSALVNFVKAGGGYVGFCAGAFMATSIIGNTHEEGLGIFPGGTNLFRADNLPNVIFSLQDLVWNGKKRYLYFEGGPFLYGYDDDPNVEVIATYDSGDTAAARTVYGKGRVFITGAHPEAPLIWTREDHVVDPDGSDRALAASMVKWASGLIK